MKELLYDDVEKIHGQYYLVCDGRAIADFHALLEAYEESVGSHRATLRSFRNLEQENARLRAALVAITDKAEEISNIYSADDCHILDEVKVFELLHLCEDWRSE